jgi:hypothetical protein
MACHSLLGTSRELFQANIIASITRWIESGNRLILFIDINKHILSGNLSQEFLHLGLQEATHEHWGDLKPCTFVYGKGKQINSVYHTPDLTIMALTQLSFHEGVGDHRTVLVDISTCSAIGKFERRAAPPKARHLVIKQDNSVKAYLRFVTKESQRHQIQRRLDNITRDLQTKRASPTHHEQLENLDMQRSNIKQGGERRCQKIVEPLRPFSPSIRGINMRQKAYVNLVAWS